MELAPRKNTFKTFHRARDCSEWRGRGEERNILNRVCSHFLVKKKSFLCAFFVASSERVITNDKKRDKLTASEHSPELKFCSFFCPSSSGGCCLAFHGSFHLKCKLSAQFHPLSTLLCIAGAITASYSPGIQIERRK
jgi:hypothetical protein